MARFFGRNRDGRSRRQRWTDRVAGIAAGIVIGLGILVYFVFVHSEGTIDAPKISEGGSSAARPEQAPAHAPRSGRPRPTTSTSTAPQRTVRRVPVVRVIGGAPPTGSGPKKLEFKAGERIRFEIDTDEPFAFEIRGLGVKQSIEGSSIISFEAKKPGQFPVIASATLIGVADLLIKPAGG